MSAAEVAQRHQARQAAAAAAVAAAGADLWGDVDPDALSASWAQLLPRLMLVLTAAQRTSAASADPYTDRVLAELGVDVDPEGQVAPRAFAGESASGAPLPAVLTSPVITTKQYIEQGADVDLALRSGGAQLDMILRTEIADAGRTATGVAIAARPTVGYTRLVTPPACPRCVILAGRFYRFSAGFQRHPNCLVPGTTVSGPSFSASTRRWYEGELVIIKTASGQQLTITGNHPVLTSEGWLPARLVDEGSYVARSTFPRGALPITTPDERQMPSLVEDVWRASRVFGITRVPTTTEDFHGDGLDGQVDVVAADRMLRSGVEAPLPQHMMEDLLTVGVESGCLSLSSREFEFLAPLSIGFGLPQSGPISGNALLSSGSRAGPPIGLGLFDVPALDSSFVQSKSNRPRGDAVALTEAFGALSALVGIDDVSHGEIQETTRWDAPAAPFSVENRASYASRGLDLLELLAGQVSLDRVVELRRVSWSGHVYNASTYEGWYAANSIVVSNCDCYHVPAPEAVAGALETDPRQLFEQGQIRGLSKADTQAIKDGADISQVVNAHRGMRTAAVHGRRLRVTSEGMTRRGSAGRRIRRQQGPQGVRLMPEEIYRIADSRAHAVELLRRNAYIL